jgi:6-O-methylguanine DNA methyltransferase, DNA binding domain.
MENDSGIEHRRSEYLDTYVQVGVAGGRVVSVGFTDEPEGDEPDEGEGSDGLKAVFAYLGGEIETTPDVPYALTVSGAERRVLERTRDLPYGTTLTYEEFAASVGEDDVERCVTRYTQILCQSSYRRTASSLKKVSAASRDRGA